MRDSFPFDPIDPPPGATEAEQLLCAGKCPECEQAAVFAPSDEFDGSLVCRNCGFEFAGAEDDRPGRPPQRAVALVYRRGAQAKRGANADRRLPPVAQRPARSTR